MAEQDGWIGGGREGAIGSIFVAKMTFVLKVRVMFGENWVAAPNLFLLYLLNLTGIILLIH